MSHAFSFFADTYETERLKTLSVWSQFRDADLGFRPQPRSRSPLEHMIHQCASEDFWFRSTLHLESGLPTLPSPETRLKFIGHYAAVSTRRLPQSSSRPGSRQFRLPD